jgi:uncharacterized membrane-anchored protein YitT (DUF2179 family)
MVNQLRRKINKSQLYSTIRNVLYVLIGCFIVAFADAAFLTPANIVSGGVVSVGIIVNYYVEAATNFNCTDIVVAGVQIILWLVGLFLLGKKFSINTLVASLSYPIFYSLLHRFNIASVLGIDVLFEEVNGAIPTANLILAGLFGGFLVGAGVAIAYLGNGSTGGFDIVSFIIAKYSDMKQDVSGFIIDSSLIVIGMICMKNITLGLIGILAALACAVAVQYIYVNADTFIIVDIISDKFEEIQEYIHKELDHGTTVLDTTGGYTGEKRKMIRVVIYKVETTELRNKIALIDPKAFVSFTQAKTINGEGFEPFRIPHLNKKRGVLHRLDDKDQYENLKRENLNKEASDGDNSVKTPAKAKKKKETDKSE